MEMPVFTRPDFRGNPLNFLREVKSEMAKIVWPTRDQVIKLTIVVIGVSFAIGVYIGGLDLALTRITGILLK